MPEMTGASEGAGATAASRQAGERGWVAVVAALVLVGLAFRTQALIIGPLVGQVQAELGMSHAVAGLLGTIPVLCMGLLAPLGPVLAASIGPRLGVAICVALVAVFGVARAFLPDTLTVLGATIGVGVGMAVVGPILSMVVRSRLPNHPAAGTGAYVVGFVIGGTITAAVAVPLADAFGGWRAAFAIVAAAAFVSLVAWLVLAPKDEGHERVAPSRPKLPWRRPAAWLLGGIFGSQSILFYGCITWLGSVYVERGWSAGQAGGLIALLTGIGLVSTLAVPAFADRVGTRRTQLTLAATLSVAGAIIVALTPGEAPGSAVTLLATALLGLGIGAYFPLALTLPVDVASDGADAASIAAFMLLIGYTLAALSPVVLGVVRDATGNFHGVVWILVAISVVMIPLALALNPARLRSAGG
ncbi:MAG: transporter, family, cyanate transporter [Chloroflexota bacterium]|jgi:CP family cyanate transporter-like MFS transporter|nr:transporter, family, cyanate transporter [Chloroflexota bacterium]